MSEQIATDADGTKVIDPGVYVVNAACPQCGSVEEIAVRIGVVVSIPDDDTGKMRVRSRGKARDHDCRQRRLVEVVR